MATTDEFYAARDQRDRARAELNDIAQRLTNLATTLRDPRGVRLNEMTGYAGPAPNHIIVDRSDLVSWERVEPAIRSFTRADDAFRRIDADLTPDHMRQIAR